MSISKSSTGTAVYFSRYRRPLKVNACPRRISFGPALIVHASTSSARPPVLAHHA
jgi:hypothetical protein